MMSYLFRRVTEELDRGSKIHGGPRAYIALADPSDFEYVLFQERRIGVIPLRGAAITQEVAALLEEIRA